MFLSEQLTENNSNQRNSDIELQISLSPLMPANKGYLISVDL